MAAEEEPVAGAEIASMLAYALRDWPRGRGRIEEADRLLIAEGLTRHLERCGVRFSRRPSPAHGTPKWRNDA